MTRDASKNDGETCRTSWEGTIFQMEKCLCSCTQIDPTVVSKKEYLKKYPDV